MKKQFIGISLFVLAVVIYTNLSKLLGFSQTCDGIVIVILYVACMLYIARTTEYNNGH